MKNRTVSWIFLILVMLSFQIKGQDCRLIRDNVGYCWKPNHFLNLIQYLDQFTLDLPDSGIMVAGISPHDDYLYAGRAYHHLYKNLRTKEVVVFGVTHSSVRKKIGDPQGKLIFDGYHRWKGLNGPVSVSPLRDLLKQNLPDQYRLESNLAHSLEHSIEATVPFLQHFNREINITPIMITGMSYIQMERVAEKTAQIIYSYIQKNNLGIGKDIFFLISSDANHYGKDFDNTPYGQDAGAHRQAAEQDKKIAEMHLSGLINNQKIRNLTRMLWGKTYRDTGHALWCGKYSIPFGILTVLKVLEKSGLKDKLKGNILYHSDTFSDGVLPIRNTEMGITAPFSLEHWVGFFSAGFYIE